MVQAVDSTENPTWEGTLERAEVFVYLTRLRASENAPNMMGASMYLQEEFGFDKYTARDLASDWRKWFSGMPREVIKEIESGKLDEKSVCNMLIDSLVEQTITDEDELPERKY